MSWLPGWERVANPRSAGGTYGTDFFPYKHRVVMHTTESRSMPNVASHPASPHLWYDPRTRQRIQCVPLDRSSFALYQADSMPHWTNKACTIQVELVGYAQEAGDWPDEYLRNIAQDFLAPVCRWVASVGGRINLANVPDPGVIPGSSYENAPQRLSWDAWANFDGVCGHRHVPGNGDRWDPGLLDQRRIAAYAAEILGGTFAPAEEEDLTPEQADRLLRLDQRMAIVWPNVVDKLGRVDDRVAVIWPIIVDKFPRLEQRLAKVEALLEQPDPPSGQVERVVDVAASLEQATLDQLLAAAARKAQQKPAAQP